MQDLSVVNRQAHVLRHGDSHIVNVAKTAAAVAPATSPRGPGLVLLNGAKTGTNTGDVETQLHRLIIGQEEATHEIVTAYRTHLAGLSPEGRPIGSFLFLGPADPRKTRAVEATAEALLGDRRAVIKIDCGKFQHGHELAKLIGSPPGHLGHPKPRPVLAQEVLNQYHTDNVRVSFVLFEEIEKASEAVWKLLLQILDKATLTLDDNRRVDFSNALIFMTSNIGAADVSSFIRPKLRVHAPGRENNCAAAGAATLSRIGVEAARGNFTLEFLRRLDKIVVFKALGGEQVNRIIDIELRLVKQCFQSAGAGEPCHKTVTDGARMLLPTEGIDFRYRARLRYPAREPLQVKPLSNLMATGRIRRVAA